MKAVPLQCGPLGRVRPALRFVRGAYGAASPPVPVRGVSRAGRALQPLRPWQPLLQPAVLAAVSECGSARRRAPIPVFMAWSPCARRTIAAMAAASRRAQRRRCSWCWVHRERDAPGFPARGGRCSTGRMDPRHRLIEPGHHHGGAGRPRHRTRSPMDLLPLRQSAARTGAPGLPAPRPASPSPLAAPGLAS